MSNQTYPLSALDQVTDEPIPPSRIDPPVNPANIVTATPGVPRKPSTLEKFRSSISTPSNMGNIDVSPVYNAVNVNTALNKGYRSALGMTPEEYLYRSQSASNAWGKMFSNIPVNAFSMFVSALTFGYYDTSVIEKSLDEIYQDPNKEAGFHFGDAAWWANGLQSVVGSALAFVASGAVIGGVAGALGKGAATILGASEKVVKGATNISATLAAAITGGHAEGTQMAASAAPQRYRDLIRAGYSSPEALKAVAAASSNEIYANTLLIGLSNFIQLRGLSKGINLFSGKYTFSPKQLLFNAIHEGFEEAVLNEMASTYGEHIGGITPAQLDAHRRGEPVPRGVSQFVSDYLDRMSKVEAWEQGFFGLFGGMIELSYFRARSIDEQISDEIESQVQDILEKHSKNVRTMDSSDEADQPLPKAPTEAVSSTVDAVVSELSQSEKAIANQAETIVGKVTSKGRVFDYKYNSKTGMIEVTPAPFNQNKPYLTAMITAATHEAIKAKANPSDVTYADVMAIINRRLKEKYITVLADKVMHLQAQGKPVDVEKHETLTAMFEQDQVPFSTILAIDTENWLEADTADVASASYEESHHNKYMSFLQSPKHFRQQTTASDKIAKSIPSDTGISRPEQHTPLVDEPHDDETIFNEIEAAIGESLTSVGPATRRSKVVKRILLAAKQLINKGEMSQAEVVTAFKQMAEASPLAATILSVISDSRFANAKFDFRLTNGNSKLNRLIDQNTKQVSYQVVINVKSLVSFERGKFSNDTTTFIEGEPDTYNLLVTLAHELFHIVLAEKLLSGEISDVMLIQYAEAVRKLIAATGEDIALLGRIETGKRAGELLYDFMGKPITDGKTATNLLTEVLSFLTSPYAAKVFASINLQSAVDANVITAEELIVIELFADHTNGKTSLFDALIEFVLSMLGVDNNTLIESFKGAAIYTLNIPTQSTPVGENAGSSATLFDSIDVPVTADDSELIISNRPVPVRVYYDGNEYNVTEIRDGMVSATHNGLTINVPLSKVAMLTTSIGEGISRVDIPVRYGRRPDDINAVFGSLTDINDKVDRIIEVHNLQLLAETYDSNVANEVLNWLMRDLIDANVTTVDMTAEFDNRVTKATGKAQPSRNPLSLRLNEEPNYVNVDGIKVVTHTSDGRTADLTTIPLNGRFKLMHGPNLVGRGAARNGNLTHTWQIVYELEQPIQVLSYNNEVNIVSYVIVGTLTNPDSSADLSSDDKALLAKLRTNDAVIKLNELGLNVFSAISFTHGAVNFTTNSDVTIGKVLTMLPGSVVFVNDYSNPTSKAFMDKKRIKLHNGSIRQYEPLLNNEATSGFDWSMVTKAPMIACPIASITDAEGNPQTIYLVTLLDTITYNTLSQAVVDMHLSDEVRAAFADNINAVLVSANEVLDSFSRNMRNRNAAVNAFASTFRLAFIRKNFLVGSSKVFTETSDSATDVANLFESAQNNYEQLIAKQLEKRTLPFIYSEGSKLIVLMQSNSNPTANAVMIFYYNYNNGFMSFGYSADKGVLKRIDNSEGKPVSGEVHSEIIGIMRQALYNLPLRMATTDAATSQAWLSNNYGLKAVLDSIPSPFAPYFKYELGINTMTINDKVTVAPIVNGEPITLRDLLRLADSNVKASDVAVAPVDDTVSEPIAMDEPVVQLEGTDQTISATEMLPLFPTYKVDSLEQLLFEVHDAVSSIPLGTNVTAKYLSEIDNVDDLKVAINNNTALRERYAYLLGEASEAATLDVLSDEDAAILANDISVDIAGFSKRNSAPIEVEPSYAEEEAMVIRDQYQSMLSAYITSHTTLAEVVSPFKSITHSVLNEVTTALYAKYKGIEADKLIRLALVHTYKRLLDLSADDAVDLRLQRMINEAVLLYNEYAVVERISRDKSSPYELLNAVINTVTANRNPTFAAKLQAYLRSHPEVSVDEVYGQLSLAINDYHIIPFNTKSMFAALLYRELIDSKSPLRKFATYSTRDKSILHVFLMLNPLKPNSKSLVDDLIALTYIVNDQFNGRHAMTKAIKNALFSQQFSGNPFNDMNDALKVLFSNVYDSTADQTIHISVADIRQEVDPKDLLYDILNSLSWVTTPEQLIAGLKALSAIQDKHYLSKQAAIELKAMSDDDFRLIMHRISTENYDYDKGVFQLKNRYDYIIDYLQHIAFATQGGNIVRSSPINKELNNQMVNQLFSNLQYKYKFFDIDIDANGNVREVVSKPQVGATMLLSLFTSVIRGVPGLTFIEGDKVMLNKAKFDELKVRGLFHDNVNVARQALAAIGVTNDVFTTLVLRCLSPDIASNNIDLTTQLTSLAREMSRDLGDKINYDRRSDVPAVKRELYNVLSNYTNYIDAFIYTSEYNRKSTIANRNWLVQFQLKLIDKAFVREFILTQPNIEGMAHGPIYQAYVNGDITYEQLIEAIGVVYIESINLSTKLFDDPEQVQVNDDTTDDDEADDDEREGSTRIIDAEGRVRKNAAAAPARDLMYLQLKWSDPANGGRGLQLMPVAADKDSTFAFRTVTPTAIVNADALFKYNQTDNMTDLKGSFIWNNVLLPEIEHVRRHYEAYLNDTAGNEEPSLNYWLANTIFYVNPALNGVKLDYLFKVERLSDEHPDQSKVTINMDNLPLVIGTWLESVADDIEETIETGISNGLLFRTENGVFIQPKIAAYQGANTPTVAYGDDVVRNMLFHAAMVDRSNLSQLYSQSLPRPSSAINTSGLTKPTGDSKLANVFTIEQRNSLTEAQFDDLIKANEKRVPLNIAPKRTSRKGTIKMLFCDDLTQSDLATDNIEQFIAEHTSDDNSLPQLKQMVRGTIKEVTNGQNYITYSSHIKDCYYKGLLSRADAIIALKLYWNKLGISNYSTTLIGNEQRERIKVALSTAVTKPVTTGTIFETRAGIPVANTIYNKCSEMVLYDDYTALNGIRLPLEAAELKGISDPDKFLENNTLYGITFNSALKEGTPTSHATIKREKGSLVLDNVDNSWIEMPLEYRGIQVNSHQPDGTNLLTNTVALTNIILEGDADALVDEHTVQYYRDLENAINSRLLALQLAEINRLISDDLAFKELIIRESLALNIDDPLININNPDLLNYMYNNLSYTAMNSIVRNIVNRYGFINKVYGFNGKLSADANGVFDPNHGYTEAELMEGVRGIILTPFTQTEGDNAGLFKPLKVTGKAEAGHALYTIQGLTSSEFTIVDAKGVERPFDLEERIVDAEGKSTYKYLRFKQTMPDGRGYLELDPSKLPIEFMEALGSRVPTTNKGAIHSIEIAGIFPSSIRGVTVLDKRLNDVVGHDFDYDSWYQRLFVLRMDEHGVVSVPFDETKQGLTNQLLALYIKINRSSNPEFVVQKERVLGNAHLDEMGDELYRTPSRFRSLLDYSNQAKLRQGNYVYKESIGHNAFTRSAFALLTRLHDANYTSALSPATIFGINTGNTNTPLRIFGEILTRLLHRYANEEFLPEAQAGEWLNNVVDFIKSKNLSALNLPQNVDQALAGMMLFLPFSVTRALLTSVPIQALFSVIKHEQTDMTDMTFFANKLNAVRAHAFNRLLATWLEVKQEQAVENSKPTGPNGTAKYIIDEFKAKVDNKLYNLFTNAVEATINKGIVSIDNPRFADLVTGEMFDSLYNTVNLSVNGDNSKEAVLKILGHLSAENSRKPEILDPLQDYIAYNLLYIAYRQYLPVFKLGMAMRFPAKQWQLNNTSNLFYLNIIDTIMASKSERSLFAMNKNADFIKGGETAIYDSTGKMYYNFEILTKSSELYNTIWNKVEQNGFLYMMLLTNIANSFGLVGNEDRIHNMLKALQYAEHPYSPRDVHGVRFNSKNMLRHYEQTNVFIDAFNLIKSVTVNPDLQLAMTQESAYLFGTAFWFPSFTLRGDHTSFEAIKNTINQMVLSPTQLLVHNGVPYTTRDFIVDWLSIEMSVLKFNQQYTSSLASSKSMYKFLSEASKRAIGIDNYLEMFHNPLLDEEGNVNQPLLKLLLSTMDKSIPVDENGTVLDGNQMFFTQRNWLYVQGEEGAEELISIELINGRVYREYQLYEHTDKRLYLQYRALNRRQTEALKRHFIRILYERIIINLNTKHKLSNELLQLISAKLYADTPYREWLAGIKSTPIRIMRDNNIVSLISSKQINEVVTLANSMVDELNKYKQLNNLFNNNETTFDGLSFADIAFLLTRTNPPSAERLATEHKAGVALRNWLRQQLPDAMERLERDHPLPIATLRDLLHFVWADNTLLQSYTKFINSEAGKPYMATLVAAVRDSGIQNLKYMIANNLDRDNNAFKRFRPTSSFDNAAAISNDRKSILDVVMDSKTRINKAHSHGLLFDIDKVHLTEDTLTRLDKLIRSSQYYSDNLVFSRYGKYATAIAEKLTNLTMELLDTHEGTLLLNESKAQNVSHAREVVAEVVNTMGERKALSDTVAIPVDGTSTIGTEAGKSAVITDITSIELTSDVSDQYLSQGKTLTEMVNVQVEKARNTIKQANATNTLLLDEATAKLNALPDNKSTAELRGKLRDEISDIERKAINLNKLLASLNRYQGKFKENTSDRLLANIYEFVTALETQLSVNYNAVLPTAAVSSVITNLQAIITLVSNAHKGGRPDYITQSWETYKYTSVAFKSTTEEALRDLDYRCKQLLLRVADIGTTQLRVRNDNIDVDNPGTMSFFSRVFLNIRNARSRLAREFTKFVEETMYKSISQARADKIYYNKLIAKLVEKGVDITPMFIDTPDGRQLATLIKQSFYDNMRTLTNGERISNDGYIGIDPLYADKAIGQALLRLHIFTADEYNDYLRNYNVKHGELMDQLRNYMTEREIVRFINTLKFDTETQVEAVLTKVEQYRSTSPNATKLDKLSQRLGLNSSSTFGSAVYIDELSESQLSKLYKYLALQQLIRSSYLYEFASNTAKANKFGELQINFQHNHKVTLFLPTDPAQINGELYTLLEDADVAQLYDMYYKMTNYLNRDAHSNYYSPLSIPFIINNTTSVIEALQRAFSLTNAKVNALKLWLDISESNRIHNQVSKGDYSNVYNFNITEAFKALQTKLMQPELDKLNAALKAGSITTAEWLTQYNALKYDVANRMYEAFNKDQLGNIGNLIGLYHTTLQKNAVNDMYINWKHLIDYISAHKEWRSSERAVLNKIKSDINVLLAKLKLFDEVVPLNETSQMQADYKVAMELRKRLINARDEILKGAATDQTSARIHVNDLTDIIHDLDALDEAYGRKDQFNVSRLLVKVMQYNSLRVLGFNIRSWNNNYFGGMLQNLVWAQDTPNYNKRDYLHAFWIAVRGYLQIYGIPVAYNAHLKKTAAIQERYGLLSTRTNDLLIEQDSLRDKAFYGSQQGERLIQGVPLYAILKKGFITLSNGTEVSLWDMLNDDGEIMYELDPTEDKQVLAYKFDKAMLLATNAIRETIEKQQGDYFNQLPTVAKQNIAGRAFTSLRQFIFSTLHEAWMRPHEQTDVHGNTYESIGYLQVILKVLGIGDTRYDNQTNKTMMGKIVQGATFILSEFLISTVSFGKSHMNLDGFLKQNGDTKVGDRIALIRFMNYTKLLLFLSAIVMLLEPDDDEDDESIIARNILNSAQDSLELYSSPVMLLNLIKDPASVVALADQVRRAGTAVYRWSTGDDIIQSGRYKGESRAFREVRKLVPIVNQWDKLHEWYTIDYSLVQEYNAGRASNK
jgi:hypothetical protein